MPTIIDNIELDEINIEFNNAVELVKYPTRPIIYLTGKAGTGKTTFLKYIKATSEKNTVVVAYTGVAAVNAGGQTINSFFQIPPQSIFLPNDIRLRTKPEYNDTDRSTIYDHFKYNRQKREVLQALELLIIDEISMVRCDLLDVIDKLLRVFKKNMFVPFGGVQVLLIGDTFQLPPIAGFQEWEILSKFYESPFFFSSNVISQNQPTYIELKKIYRQKEQDFINLLDKIRINQVTSNDLYILNTRYNPTFNLDGKADYITLASHNYIVDNTNLTRLNELSSELKIFEGTVTGTFPDNIMPTDKYLQLKEGAQVMFVKNNWVRGYYNGKIGQVVKIEDNRIIVKFFDNTYNQDKEISLERETWKNIRYIWEPEKKKIDEEVIGTYTQFPLRLAWAITVHKSQGLTFDYVIADIGAAFDYGQVYVGLSRCTSFNGLVLKSKIERDAIKTDPRVLQFAQNETPSTLIIQQLNYGKADYYYKKCREAIKHGNSIEAYKALLEAIKFRDDTKTEIFNRYFTLYISKLQRLKITNQTNVSKIQKLTSTIDELQNRNESLQNQITEANQKINQQNKALKSLIDDVENLKTEIESKNSYIDTLTRTKEKLSADIKNFQSEKTSKKKVLKPNFLESLRNLLLLKKGDNFTDDNNSETTTKDEEYDDIKQEKESATELLIKKNIVADKPQKVTQVSAQKKSEEKNKIEFKIFGKIESKEITKKKEDEDKKSLKHEDKEEEIDSKKEEQTKEVDNGPVIDLGKNTKEIEQTEIIEQTEAESEDKYFIKTNYEKIIGPNVVGKIDLNVFKKPKKQKPEKKD